MGGHNQGRALFRIQFEQQFDNVFAGFTVQIAGGFISKQTAWPGGKSTGNGAALLFAPR
jgi:hypothetical protein